MKDYSLKKIGLNGGNFNLFDQFLSRFSQCEKAIKVQGGQDLSRDDIERIVSSWSAQLISEGLKLGDRVSVVAEKSVSVLLLYFVCLRNGYIFNPLNPSYTEQELVFFLGDSRASLVIFDAQSFKKIKRVGTKFPDLKSIAIADFDLEASAPKQECSREYIASDDIAALIYSSGTTGKPKGICLSYGNLLSNGLALKKEWNFEKSDIVLHTLPLYHVHGLFIILSPAFLAGSSIVLLRKFDAKVVIDLLSSVTIMSGVPTYYSRMLKNHMLKSINLSKIKIFLSGSAPLSRKLFEEFKRVTGHSILERYGMTETGVISSNPLNGTRKSGSVGLAITETFVRLVHDGSVISLPQKVGEIQVKGTSIFKQYWNRSESPFNAEGWFSTGDLAKRDEDGYIFIVGRSKDLIISGGMNVYPTEVETVIERISGIQEASVFGVPHEDFGEAVMVAIIKDSDFELDEKNVTDSLKDNLANYKIPKAIILLEELPRNSMGKVQKNKLRSEYSNYFSV